MKPQTAAQILEVETAAAAARALMSDQEVRRHRGVSWSGFAPEAEPPLDPQVLRRTAEGIHAARAAWRAGASGRLIAAIAEGQRAAGLAHQALERGRAAWSRGLTGEEAHCHEAVREAETAALRLLRSARSARRTLAIEGYATPRPDRAAAARSAPRADAHE